MLWLVISTWIAAGYFCRKGMGSTVIHPWSIQLLAKCTNCKRAGQREQRGLGPLHWIATMVSSVHSENQFNWAAIIPQPLSLDPCAPSATIQLTPACWSHFYNTGSQALSQNQWIKISRGGGGGDLDKLCRCCMYPKAVQSLRFSVEMSSVHTHIYTRTRMRTRAHTRTHTHTLQDSLIADTSPPRTEKFSQ